MPREIIRIALSHADEKHFVNIYICFQTLFKWLLLIMWWTFSSMWIIRFSPCNNNSITHITNRETRYREMDCPRSQNTVESGLIIGCFSVPWLTSAMLCLTDYIISILRSNRTRMGWEDRKKKSAFKSWRGKIIFWYLWGSAYRGQAGHQNTSGRGKGWVGWQEEIRARWQFHSQLSRILWWHFLSYTTVFPEVNNHPLLLSFRGTYH